MEPTRGTTVGQAKIKDIKEWNQLEALLLDTAKIKDIKEWNQLEALLLDTAIEEWNQLEALLLDTAKIKDNKEWNQLEAILLDTAKSVLGQTTGKGAYNEKEVWWWNEDVQKAVKEKRLKFKKYQEYRCDEDKEVFREANKKAKREVAKAKESACKDLYDKLDSIEGQKII